MKQLQNQTYTYKPAADVPASDSIGLVLAGGGTKGVYEIGAWKALDELGLMSKINGFSGSSIGAFNTALFVNGDLQAAIQLWEDLTMADFADINTNLIKERIEEGKGHTPAEAFEQNIRIRYTAGKLADKATGTARDVLGNQVDKIAGILDRSYAPELSETHSLPDQTSAFSESIPERQLNYNRHTGRNFWIWCLQNLFGCGYALPDRLRQHLADLLPSAFHCPENKRAFSTVCEWDAEKSCSGRAFYVSWQHRNLQEILDLIVASASLPVFYPTREINGKTYVDGGYADNEPIQPLYDIGYRKILIIYLDKYKGKKLNQIIKEQENAYPGCEFLRLFPNRKFNDSFTGSCRISEKLTAERMQSGYEDGRKLFEKNASFFL